MPIIIERTLVHLYSCQHDVKFEKRCRRRLQDLTQVATTSMIDNNQMIYLFIYLQYWFETNDITCTNKKTRSGWKKWSGLEHRLFNRTHSLSFVVLNENVPDRALGWIPTFADFQSNSHGAVVIFNQSTLLAFSISFSVAQKSKWLAVN